MRLGLMKGVVDRQVLVNYRVQPEAARRLLPAPFRPRLFRGAALAQLCLLRLRRVRPAFLPAAMGCTSENAAVRIVAEWDSPRGPGAGYFLLRRETSSRMDAYLNGRVLPGAPHFARFRVQESLDRVRIEAVASDRAGRIALSASLTPEMPTASVFRSRQEAVDFLWTHQACYTPLVRPGTFEGIDFHTSSLQAYPLAVDDVACHYLEDRRNVPADAIVFDSALLFRNLSQEWTPCERLRAIESEGGELAPAGACRFTDSLRVESPDLMKQVGGKANAASQHA
ncbi:MAG TPA: DUF2071 domain-containing protein [Pirellulales bacterium]